MSLKFSVTVTISVFSANFEVVFYPFAQLSKYNPQYAFCYGKILKQPFNLILRGTEMPTWIYSIIGIGTLTSTIERIENNDQNRINGCKIMKWYDDVMIWWWMWYKTGYLGVGWVFLLVLPSWYIITFNFQVAESNLRQNMIDALMKIYGATVSHF